MPTGTVLDPEMQRLSKEGALELIKDDEMPVGAIMTYIENDGDDRIYGWLLKATKSLTRDLRLRLKPGQEFDPVASRKMARDDFLQDVCHLLDKASE